MSKKGKRSQDGQYVPMPYAVLKSTAWRSLSGAAVKIWFELHARYNGGNNGRLHLSMNEAAKNLGIGKATAQRGFLELQEKGFIALESPGNWYSRRAHDWRLTTKPMQTTKGKETPTNDWRSWSAKTKHGSNSDPSPCPVVPFQNQPTPLEPATEPVRPVSDPRLGSGMEH